MLIGRVARRKAVLSVSQTRPIPRGVVGQGSRQEPDARESTLPHPTIIIAPTAPKRRGVARRSLIHKKCQQPARQHSQNQARSRSSNQNEQRPAPAQTASVAHAGRRVQTRIPSSRSRFDTEYAAIPKTPVTASKAASSPITPRQP
jgi:hypothetical protein